MKKFFSLLCALAIVLGASAAPVSKKAHALKFQRAAVEQLEAEKKAPVKKAVKQTALDKASKAVAPAFRAQKELAEAVDVKCASWDIQDWGEDGELYLYGEDNTYAFYFDIIYGSDAEDLILGHTYTVEDIWVGSDGMYGGVFYDGEWHYGIKELSLVKTKDEAGLVHFAGSCTDSLDAEFTFHYDELPFVPSGDTISHSFSKCATMSYSSQYKDWTIRAKDTQFEFQLDILSENADSPVGEYSSDNNDFDLNYTNVEVYVTPDSSLLFQPHSVSATITESNDSTFIHAEILAENGDVYVFDAFYATPQKQGEVSIDATNLVLDDSWYGYFGIIWASASNEQYSISLILYAASGTLNAGEDFTGSIKNLTTGEETEIYSGSITISNLDGIQINGAVLCYDNIEYTLHLAYVLPEPGRRETIEGTGLLYLENQEDLLYWEAMALNQAEDRYVSFLAIADDPAGTYTLDDLYAQYTYVGVFTAPADTAWYGLIDANITVTVNGEVANITGTLLGQNDDDASDVVEFTVNLVLQVVNERTEGGGNQYDAQDEPFKKMFPQYNIDDQYVAQYNVFVVDAQNEDNSYISLEINVPEGTTQLQPGVYPIASTEEPNTVNAGSVDQYIYGSFAGFLTDGGQISLPLWLFADGNVTILENGVIQVNVVNTWGAQIECQLGTWPEAIDNTDAEIKAAKIVRDGKLIIIKNGVEYNAQGATLK